MSDPLSAPAKRIVITGVSRGLGRAMAKQFIRRGHTVCACARNESTLNELRDKFGAPHQFDVVDVADDAQVQAWAMQIIQRTGAPDLLLNNAAIINPNAPLWETSPEMFSDVVDVNVKGVASCVRYFLPAMIDRGEGVVVNFSSGWGRSVSPEVATYCATKWAIEGLTRALAQELPEGLAAVPLNPGVINTEMLQSCFGTGAKGYPDADAWAERAVPFLLDIGPENNGQPLTVPS